MAAKENSDFYISFGSDAKLLAAKLKSDLEPAYQVLNAFQEALNALGTNTTAAVKNAAAATGKATSAKSKAKASSTDDATASATRKSEQAPAASVAGTPKVFLDEAALNRVVEAVGRNVAATNAVRDAVVRLGANQERGGTPVGPRGPVSPVVGARVEQPVSPLAARFLPPAPPGFSAAQAGLAATFLPPRFAAGALPPAPPTRTTATGGEPPGGLGRILGELKSIHATLRRGITVTGKGLTGKASATDPDVVAATGKAKAKKTRDVSPASTPEGREAAIAALPAEIRKAVQEEDKLAAATKLVTEGVLHQRDAMALFRDIAKSAGKEAPFTPATLKASVGDARLLGRTTQAANDAEAEQKAAARRAFLVASGEKAKNEEAAHATTRLAQADSNLATIMGRLSVAAKAEVAELARLKAAGASDAEITLQRAKAYAVLARELAELNYKTPQIRQQAATVFSAAPSADPNKPGGAGVKTTREDLIGIGQAGDPKAAEAGKATGQLYGASMAQGAGGAFERAFFGGGGFFSRILHSAGTFVVRNFSAGLVFGLTGALHEAISQGVETESTFVRVSQALEQTGRSSAGLRTDLSGLSQQYGVALKDVYTTTAGLTGLFDQSDKGNEQLVALTKTAVQLELISGGALNATEAMRSLASATSAYTGIAKEHFADVATVIQNQLGTNVEDTLEGVARLSGQAKLLGLDFENAATYVAAIAKFTGQSGAGAGEQFSRILASLQTGRTQKIIKTQLGKVGIDVAPLFNKRDYQGVLDTLLANFNDPKLKQGGGQDIIANALGGQRQAASTLALLVEGQKVLTTVTAAKHADGAADQRATSISGQLANQVKRLHAEFINLFATLVRTGALNAVALIFKGMLPVFAALNYTLNTFNDLMDTNVVTKAIRQWGFALLGFLAIFKIGKFLIGGFVDSLKRVSATRLLAAGGVPGVAGVAGGPVVRGPGGAPVAAPVPPQVAAARSAIATAGVQDARAADARATLLGARAAEYEAAKAAQIAAAGGAQGVAAAETAYAAQLEATSAALAAEQVAIKEATIAAAANAEAKRAAAAAGIPFPDSKQPGFIARRLETKRQQLELASRDRTPFLTRSQIAATPVPYAPGYAPGQANALSRGGRKAAVALAAADAALVQAELAELDASKFATAAKEAEARAAVAMAEHEAVRQRVLSGLIVGEEALTADTAALAAVQAAVTAALEAQQVAIDAATVATAKNAAYQAAAANAAEVRAAASPAPLFGSGRRRTGTRTDDAGVPLGRSGRFYARQATSLASGSESSIATAARLRASSDTVRGAEGALRTQKALALAYRLGAVAANSASVALRGMAVAMALVARNAVLFNAIGLGLVAAAALIYTGIKSFQEDRREYKQFFKENFGAVAKPPAEQGTGTVNAKAQAAQDAYDKQRDKDRKLGPTGVGRALAGSLGSPDRLTFSNLFQGGGNPVSKFLSLPAAAVGGVAELFNVGNSKEKGNFDKKFNNDYVKAAVTTNERLRANRGNLKGLNDAITSNNADIAAQIDAVNRSNASSEDKELDIRDLLNMQARLQASGTKMLLAVQGIGKLNIITADQLDKIGDLVTSISGFSDSTKKLIADTLQASVDNQGFDGGSDYTRLFGQLEKPGLSPHQKNQIGIKLQTEAIKSGQVALSTIPKFDTEGRQAQIDLITKAAATRDQLIQADLQQMAADATALAEASRATGDYLGAAATAQTQLNVLRRQLDENAISLAQYQAQAGQIENQAAQDRATQASRSFEEAKLHTRNSVELANLELQSAQAELGELQRSAGTVAQIKAARVHIQEIAIALAKAEVAAAELAAHPTADVNPNGGGVRPQGKDPRKPGFIPGYTPAPGDDPDPVGTANAEAQKDLAARRKKLRDAQAELARLLKPGADLATINAGIRRVQTAAYAAVDNGNELQIAQMQTALSKIAPGDALGQASQKLQIALTAQRNAAAAFGTNSVQYEQATQGVIDAQRGIDDAVQGIVDANTSLAVALAEAAGHTVDVARIQLDAALQKLRRARVRSGGARSAEVISAEADAVAKRAALRDASYQDQLDTIDFNVQIGRMTANAAIAALQEMLRATNLTRAQRRELLLKIKGLQDDVRNSLTSSGFNIPGSIKLPTPYEVRRSLGLDTLVKTVNSTVADSMAALHVSGPLGSSTSDVVSALNSVVAAVQANGSQQVNVDMSNQFNVPTAAVATQIANQVIRMINDQTSRQVKANSSTPRLVGTG